MQRVTAIAARPFNVVDVEADIAAALQHSPPLRDPGPQDYAPAIPMPSYVEHRNDVSEVGRLSAEVVIREYEATAKEIEQMGDELKRRVEKLEETRIDAVQVLDEIKDTAARYREEGKRIFLQIEDCALMTSEVRATCDALKTKIAGPSS